MKLFVCLIVIICFIIYYTRRKEKFLSESQANLLGEKYNTLKTITSDLKISNILNPSTNEIEIIIEYDDDRLTDEILKYTYENLNYNDEIFKNDLTFKVNNPTMILNGNELIQLTKITSEICDQNFIFRIPLSSYAINFEYIKYFMTIIKKYFSVPVNNIKFFFDNQNQQRMINVIIYNTNIDTLRSMYNTYKNDNKDSISSIVCPIDGGISNNSILGTTTNPTSMIDKTKDINSGNSNYLKLNTTTNPTSSSGNLT